MAVGQQRVMLFVAFVTESNATVRYGKSMPEPGCHYCSEPAELQCATCGRLYCANHGDDVCLRCLAPESSVPANLAYRGALATLIIATLVTVFLVVRPPESKSKADAPRLVPTSTVAVGPTATATPPRTPPRTASGPTTTVRTAVPSSSPDASPSPTTGGETTYVVRGGDTLGAIAEQFGVRLDALIAANPGVDATPLQVGATLKIPKAQ